MEQGSDYVIGVKQNQPTLFRQFQEQTAVDAAAVSRDTRAERNKGREEIREVLVFAPHPDLDPEWEGVNQFIRVERSVWRGSTVRTEAAYYLSSVTVSARTLNQGIRGHWGIENRLHWVKDVTFGEDRSRIRTGTAPETLSIIRNMVINVLRKHGYQNVAQAFRLLSNNIKKIKGLLE